MATTVTRIQNFIDGEPADATKGRTETVVNPATAAPLAEAPLSSAQDVDRAVQAAGRAADTLKRVHLELGGKAPVVVFDDVVSGLAEEGTSSM